MSVPSSKSKGCFQCTKRRIVCDKAEPVCVKCKKKGIECSGPRRIRFSTGVAQRGRLKGCAIPAVDGLSHSTFGVQFEPSAAVPRQIRWKNDPPTRGKRKAAKRTSLTKRHEEVCRNASDGASSSRKGILDNSSTPSLTEDMDDIDEYVHSVSEKSSLETTIGPLAPWIAPMDSQTRMLMSHFADHVAPVMVVLDISNGYREVLLPLACGDQLLQRAVGVVAAQHMALHQPSYQQVADRGRAAIISRLRKESLASSPDRVFNLSTWATLIVLLVGETITGSSEYGYLLQSLLCLAQSIDQVRPSSARQFLTQQTHMFEFLGLPFLGEQQGINVLQLPLEHYLDWTLYDLPPDSEHNHLLHISQLAFKKASEIYLGRATSDQDQWELLEGLKHLVSQVEPDQMGSHALVWVCFIAAADSTDPEHRRFFVDRMNRVFSKTKFQNISAGMQSLPTIWSQQSAIRWTQNLTQLASSLVM